MKKPHKLTLTITMDTETGKMGMSAPKDFNVAFAMLHGALSMVFHQSHSEKPERKVKTLDEIADGHGLSVM